MTVQGEKKEMGGFNIFDTVACEGPFHLAYSIESVAIIISLHDGGRGG